MSINKFSDFEP